MNNLFKCEVYIHNISKLWKTFQKNIKIVIDIKMRNLCDHVLENRLFSVELCSTCGLVNS